VKADLGDDAGSNDAAARAVALLQSGSPSERALALALLLALAAPTAPALTRVSTKPPSPSVAATRAALGGLARELVADSALAAHRKAVESAFPSR